MKAARMHRASRVDFDANDIIFPIRTAVDLREQRAERCRNLHEVITGNVAPDAGKSGDGEAGEVWVNPETSTADPLPDAEPADEPPQLAIPEYPHDARGIGETVDGNQIRRYIASTRPPSIASKAWQKMSPATKRKAIAEYLEALRAMQQAYRDQFEAGHPGHLHGLPGYDPGNIWNVIRDPGKASGSDAPPVAAITVAQYVGSKMRPTGSASKSGKDKGSPCTSDPGTRGITLLGDYWEPFNGGVVRWHCSDRASTFSPESKHLIKNCPIPIERFGK